MKTQSLRILYIGNMLSVHGNNLSYIETLGPLLSQSGYQLSYASDKKNKVLRLLDMFRTLLSKRNDIDVVLIDTYSTLNYWYAILIGKMCKNFNISYIPILHGGNLPHRLKTSRRSFTSLIKHSLCAVSPSQYLQSKLLDAGFSKVLVIRNTIALQDYTFKYRKVVSPKLLWVRSFSEIYNPLMAVKVFKRLKDRFPDAELCMVGPDKDGSLERTQQLAKEMNVQVSFPGKMSKEAWREISESYDVFINTTHFDNVPISVLEAMALGLPVVSTNVGGIPYMLEHKKTALLVGDNDVEEMYAAIVKLIEFPELTESLTKAARKEVEEHSWHRVKNHWNSLLAQVEKRA